MEVQPIVNDECCNFPKLAVDVVELRFWLLGRTQRFIEEFYKKVLIHGYNK